jgi:hypothetical protein
LSQSQLPSAEALDAAEDYLRYNRYVEKIVRKFDSHAEALAADRAYYKSLTPEQRMDILLDLINAQRSSDETSQRLARVCRVVKRRPR